jgi:uncharacterized protein (TIGR02680 family)
VTALNPPPPAEAPDDAPGAVPARPAPGDRVRFVPTRAGIINLWDYRDEEFSFAGGWLILRGANGSGKTKALEVLFPFVLDGRIDPKRLNPFASEDRTMKSNLLFRGQDSAYGYVWLEFASPLTGEAVTVGAGLHAQKHRDQPKRWYFVTDGRVGSDFSLLGPDDRPLTRKQLAAQIGEQALGDSPSDHRAAVDARLFSLGKERYEQLITLILTLRRPQLAKNLDPAKLSDTLTDGLRPLDDDLIAEAARSFDDMETVQRTLEGLVAADEAASVFVATYATYLRTHARAAADALTARREEAAGRRRDLTEARRTRVEAGEAYERAEQRTRAAGEELTRLRAHLDQLKSSAAYQAHEQLADLERLVQTLQRAAADAVTRLERRKEATRRAEDDLAEAAETLAELEAAVSRAAAALVADAADAGLTWSAADAEPDGFAQRVAALVAGRADDVRAVREALAAHRDAVATRTTAQQTLDGARTAVEEAEAAERAAEDGVQNAREQTVTELRQWAGRHANVLPPGLVDQVGEPDTPSLPAVFTEGTAAAVQAHRDDLSALRSERRRTETERDKVQAERALIEAERDDAPPAFAARTAPRGGRAGAPLWRLVRFADDVPDDTCAAIEAALEAANLLDAWMHPSTGQTDEALAAGESDGYLRPGTPVTGPSLADLLVPEEDAVVPAERVTAALRSIALVDRLDGAGAQIGRTGTFAQGVQVGAHTKAAAEYIGATARARRRAARLADCDRRLAELAGRLADLDRGIGDVEAALDVVRAAGGDLPKTGAVMTALRAHERAAGRLRATREALDGAQAGYDQAVARCGVAERALRKTTAERSLAPDTVDEVAAALRRFESGAAALTGARREETAGRTALWGASTRLEQARRDETETAEAEQAARLRHTEEAAKLAALHETVGAEAQQVLEAVRRTSRDIGDAGREAEAARREEKAATQAAGSAQAREQAAEEALGVATREERVTARGLAPYSRPELLEVLRCPLCPPWPGQEDDWTGEELPAPVVALYEAILAVTKDLTPTESSLKQATTRLTKALDDLQNQLTGAGQDYRPEWDGSDGIIVVRVAEEDGLLPVGAFATKISAARRDQQDLLTESEQRTLEDGILTRIAQQIHDRTVDARDLIRRMSGEMRARKMSSGTTIGVAWQLADHLDAEQRAVCQLLSSDAVNLGPDDLTRMRGHFASQIKLARARHRDKPYRELLAEVLDYRRWRTFGFELVRPGGQPERLTRARHSRLSGGEQSVSLHLPLFAAAHAMLNSARSDAPRLLALDEAFAGVDDNGRSELMGLAAQFDLDLFMTGYDLWATHATVPAAAHYDLVHSPIEHTVSALLLVWDGAELIADDTGDLAAALGSPGTRRTRAEPGGMADELG